MGCDMLVPFLSPAPVSLGVLHALVIAHALLIQIRPLSPAILTCPSLLPTGLGAFATGSATNDAFAAVLTSCILDSPLPLAGVLSAPSCPRLHLLPPPPPGSFTGPCRIRTLLEPERVGT